jgi:hypothetical protein
MMCGFFADSFCAMTACCSCTPDDGRLRVKAYVGEQAVKAIRSGCEGLTVSVRLIMFEKFATESKQRISRTIPL